MMQELFSSLSTLSLKDATWLRCSKGRLVSCKRCDTCCLRKRTAQTKQWFSKLGDNSRKQFLMCLVENCVSVDVLDAILIALKPCEFKDFTYSRSRLRPGNSIDVSVNESDHCLPEHMVFDTLTEYVKWFKTLSHWSKTNYLMFVLQMCDPYLLYTTKNKILMLYEDVKRATAHVRPATPSSLADTVSRAQSPDGMTANGRGSYARPQSINQAISSTLKYSSNLGIYSRADDSSAEENYENEIRQSPISANHIQEEKSLCVREVRFSNVPVSNSCYSTTDKFSRYLSSEISSSLGMEEDEAYKDAEHIVKSAIIDTKRTSSARCSPYLGKSFSDTHLLSNKRIGSASLSEDYVSCDDADFETYSEDMSSIGRHYGLIRCKDFIRCLPVHLSKYILSLLDVNSLTNCLCVSLHWRILAEEVKGEDHREHSTQGDVLLLQQSSTGKRHNSSYARRLPVHVLKVNENGDPIVNDEPKHVNIDDSCDLTAESRDMQWCYDGYETEMVEMEERNVYCGAYNILVLTDQKDVGRITYYGGSNYVPIGSTDRKIKVMNLSTSKCERVIHGHAGSIRSILFDEKRKVIISGSYDTTIRCWDVKTGKATLLFRGHRGSVTCLSLSGRNLASGSMDKAVKVWNMDTGRCRRTFKHRKVVKTIVIDRDLLVTGCNDGKVRLWNFEAGELVKILGGHFNSLTCVKFNDFHIATGSLDCYVMVWSTRSSFQKCLQSFRHPREVLCLEIMYCRVISGSADGKIRVWSILNGECLRILRGNSKNDAIVALYAVDDRLLVNTHSNLLLYKFQHTEWNYDAPMDGGVKIGLTTTARQDESKTPHSYCRAVRLRRQGSSLHQRSESRGVSEDQITYECQERGQNRRPSSSHVSNARDRRVKSAPLTSGTRGSITSHIQRIKSASSVEKKIETELTSVVKRRSKKPVGKSDQLVTCPGELVHEISYAHSILNQSNDSLQQAALQPHPSFVARSRSAPALRRQTLPAGRRGFTTDSPVPPHILRCISPVKKQQLLNSTSKMPQEATTLAISPTERFSNLRLKSYYQQIQFEDDLRQTPLRQMSIM